MPVHASQRRADDGVATGLWYGSNVALVARDIPPEFAHVEALYQELRKKTQAMAEMIKRVRRGDPTADLPAARREVAAAFDRLSAELRAVQDQLGIPEELLLELEKGKRPPLEQGKLWRHGIETTDKTAELNLLVEVGLERLLRGVNPAWLAEQRAKEYRLGLSFLAEPLHIVSGVRLPPNSRPGRP